jgi:hypothetical protein
MYCHLDIPIQVSRHIKTKAISQTERDERR